MLASSPVTIRAPLLDGSTLTIPTKAAVLAPARRLARGAHHDVSHGICQPEGLESSPKLAGLTKEPRDSSSPDSSDSTPPGEAESTFRLIKRYRGGDKQALEQLFARHLPRLRRWATGRLPRWARDVADTQDLVQETLLQTFNRIDVFEPAREGALQAYLRQAVMNRIRDEIRRKARRPVHEELEGTEVDQARSPLEEAIGMEEIERYENALAQLRPEEREMIILRVELGYSYDEVARLLDKPTSGAAHKATKRALVRLAEEMARGK
jgi:RNA polymerase sigma factor (sigma-70 family)